MNTTKTVSGILFSLLIIGLCFIFYYAQKSSHTNEHLRQTHSDEAIGVNSQSSLPGADLTSQGHLSANELPQPEIAQDLTVSHTDLSTESKPSGVSALEEPPPPRSIADILEGVDLSDPNVREQVVQQARASELHAQKEAFEKAKLLGIPTRIEQEDGRVIELVGFEGDEPIYRTTHNRSAAIASAASSLALTPYGLSGQDVNVGVWDEGSVRSSHVELINRTNLGDPGAGLSDHGTHVAGTIAASGVSSSAKGMAPAARVESYDWNQDLTEMLAVGAASASDTNKVSISNHSYGFISGYLWDGSNWRWFGDGTGASDLEQDFGRYHSSSRDWDAVAHSLPYLTIFKAAGNDRSDDPSNGRSVYSPSGNFLFTYSSGLTPSGDGVYRNGYENQSFAALAKNIITVGAVNDAVSGSSRSLASAGMSEFSCWGPTDDGRIKPDLVANGVSVYSTFAGGDAAYSSISGTSMATPSAAGSAALIVELYRNQFAQGLMRSSLLKGLLIHTADDLGPVGPDYQFGWGHINVQAAADLLLEHKANISAPRIIEDSMTTQASTYTYQFEWDGTSPIRATLCWTDPAGSAQSVHDSRTPNLVNNLDLVLTSPNGQVFQPFVMPFVGNWGTGSMSQLATTGKNNVDNVEQVLISAPPQVGTYTATISVDGALANGRQAFSLVISGVVASGGGNLDTRVLRLSGDTAFGAVEVGQSVTRSVTLRNVGNTQLTVSRVELPNGFAGNWSGALNAGSSESFDVTYSPSSTGPVNGLIKAYSDADNGVVSQAVSGEGVAATVINNLTNGVPVNGLSGANGSERYYRIAVPPNQSEMSFEISGSGDADIYVRFGALPTLSDWDYRPYFASSNEEVIISGPSAGDWYVMIRGYSSYSDLSLLASYESSVLATRIIELQGDLNFGNIPVGDSVSRQLTIRNLGNAPLSITSLSLPSGFSGNWSGQIAAGSSATVSLAFMPVGEQVYTGQVVVNSDKTSGANTRSISGTGVITQVGLQNGVTAGPFNGLAGSSSFFYIDVPSGQSLLRVALQGADGEADVYMKFGSRPDLADFDLRSSDVGNDDVLTVNNPSAGRWFIMLHAVTQITEIRLVAEYYDTVATQRIIRLSGDLDFGSVRVNQTASRNLAIHNDGDVSLSVFGLSLPDGFSSSWSGTIAASESRIISVDFSPSAAASYAGAIDVQSDATTGTSSISVSGLGVADDSVVDLDNGLPVSGLSGAAGSEQYFRLRVPNSATLLSVSISGSNGDADLYLRYDAMPTLNEYDYRPYLNDSNESVDVIGPDSGDWFIMVHGFSQYDGLTLNASYLTSTGEVVEFTNPQEIFLNDSGAGSVYPSQINVSGLSGAIGNVAVTLHDLTHTFPADIDVLLVAPGGTSVLLMSDAGGGDNISGLNLKFSDDATSQLGQNNQLSSGVYRPTNYSSGDTFDSPAPGGPYEGTLSVLDGLDPNGTWSLYLFDDAGVDSGSLGGGWTLEIETDIPLLTLADLTDGSGTHELTPANASIGSQMDFSVDILNQGGQVSGDFEVTLQLSMDTDFTPSDIVLVTIPVLSIDAGELYTLDASFTLPAVSVGDYYLGWEFDSGGVVDESNEDNNKWYRTRLVRVSINASDDPYEENDTYDTAFPSLQEGVWLSAINGPGIQADEDWYSISATGGDILQVSCLFDHSEGDIDIALHDSNGVFVPGAYSESVTSNEFMEITVPVTGDYYIAVYYGDVGNHYDLRWQTYSGNIAPSASTVRANLPGETINDSLFTTDTRFDWQGYVGNWSYLRVSANEGMITQTFDQFSNDPDVYREETLFTFVNERTGTYVFRQYDQGVLINEEVGNFQFPWLPIASVSWYSSATFLSDGWRYFDWFKGFKPEGNNWIYHGRHGWLYVIAQDTNLMFLWDGALSRWLFTNETIYPWMYAYGPNGGWVFFFEGGRPGSRYFKRGDNGQVVSEQELSVLP